MKKILVLDIETAPITAYVWGRHDQNIALNQIKVDWYVLGWAAKWLGNKTMAYVDQRNAPDMTNDAAILRPLWDLLNEADILVTQNGKAFDVKKLNARFIMHGWAPPSPYKHLDTYLIAKNVGAFTAHSLEYLSDKLCTKYKKLKHTKFPGQEMWNECLKGNKKAWVEMEKYNKYDVLATEELYLKLRAWIPANSPAVSDLLCACVACGATKHLQRRGTEVTKIGVYARLQCHDCGKWQRGSLLAKRG